MPTLTATTTSYRVRPLVAADREHLVDMLTACSRTSLYQRFMTLSPSAPREYVDCALSDPDSYVVVVEARVAGAWRIVAEGSLFFSGGRSAEIALLVRDGHHGAGLGALVVRHLCRYAAGRGVTRLEATALAGNRRVIQLFQRVVGAVELDPPDAGVVAMVLRPDASQWTDPTPAPAVALALAA